MGLDVFYLNDIQIKPTCNQWRHMTDNQNVTHKHTMNSLKVYFRNWQKGETIAAFPTAGLHNGKAVIGIYGSATCFLKK